MIHLPNFEFSSKGGTASTGCQVTSVVRYSIVTDLVCSISYLSQVDNGSYVVSIFSKIRFGRTTDRVVRQQNSEVHPEIKMRTNSFRKIAIPQMASEQKEQMATDMTEGGSLINRDESSALQRKSVEIGSTSLQPPLR